jgi:uncharacterized protein YdhG (YjbR/CyaY superfamily)
MKADPVPLRRPTPGETIDAYVASFPPDVQALLEKVRRTIRKAVPEAQEAISYRIPAFKLNGRYLIYFAGFKKHIGLYPVHADTAEFQQEIATYGAGKATLQFPLDQPIPVELIARVVKLKALQSRAAANKRKARP